MCQKILYVAIILGLMHKNTKSKLFFIVLGLMHMNTRSKLFLSTFLKMGQCGLPKLIV
jgi:hypothetical protein